MRGFFVTYLTLFLVARNESLGLFWYEIRILFVFFALFELSLVLLVYVLVVGSGFVIRRHCIFQVPRVHSFPSQV